MTSTPGQTPAWKVEGGTDPEAPRWAQSEGGGDWVGLAQTLAEPPGRHDDDGNASQDIALGNLYREAYEEGIARAKSTVTALMDRYHSAIAELGTIRERIFRESEEELTLLALHIAEQVMSADADAMLELTLRMVQQCLDELKNADQITLRVAPTDVRAIQTRFPGLCDGMRVKVVADESVGLGGVVAECELGRVDATFRHRLEEITRQIMDSMGRSGGSP